MKELLNCTKFFPRYPNRDPEDKVRRRSLLPFFRRRKYKVICELKNICHKIHKPGADLPKLYDRFQVLMVSIDGQTRICWIAFSERVSVLAYKKLQELRARQKTIRQTLKTLKGWASFKHFQQLYNESAYIYSQIKRLEATYNTAFDFTIAVHLGLEYGIED